MNNLHMKPSFSDLAERQTVRVDKVANRVSVRMRQLRDGTITRDVMVDGYVYTPAISENWLAENLAKIVQIVAGKNSEMHLGMGQWDAA